MQGGMEGGCEGGMEGGSEGGMEEGSEWLQQGVQAIHQSHVVAVVGRAALSTVFCGHLPSKQPGRPPPHSTRLPHSTHLPLLM
ncbi:hypothetical protein Pmani_018495 [Petrolisthes manimaculis]|uniref:Uncharacterized protein n=1 Tax=Petrolisthes manimaculis TaxID=1843537 RepID=A0AAE1U4T3_9EUCA|nr:hypothetical protein Pmani_018495 [Petrolisthes manimaculis]